MKIQIAEEVKGINILSMKNFFCFFFPIEKMAMTLKT